VDENLCNIGTGDVYWCPLLFVQGLEKMSVTIKEKEFKIKYLIV
jgi:hypothetical protein